MNRSWQFFTSTPLYFFFFIDLVPPQIYDRLIRKEGGVLFYNRGRCPAGSGGVKLATKKTGCITRYSPTCRLGAEHRALLLVIVAVLEILLAT